LKEPLRLLKRLCKPELREEAIISYDDDSLHIDLGGMSVAIPAIGEWPGQARVPGDFILSMARLPPTTDPLILLVEDARFHFGSASVGCAWQAPWSALIDLPMNPTFKTILALRFRYTEEEIRASGWIERLRTAEEYRDHFIVTMSRRLAHFGVRPDDLRR